MTRITADISVSLDGFVFTGGAPRTLGQRSVISTSTATHLTYDVSR
jgi:hypothetical protein